MYIHNVCSKTLRAGGFRLRVFSLCERLRWPCIHHEPVQLPDPDSPRPHICYYATSPYYCTLGLAHYECNHTAVVKVVGLLFLANAVVRSTSALFSLNA